MFKHGHMDNDNVVEYCTPLDPTTYAPELKFAKVNLNTWFTISYKSPDLTQTTVTELHYNKSLK